MRLRDALMLKAAGARLKTETPSRKPGVPLVFLTTTGVTTTPAPRERPQNAIRAIHHNPYAAQGHCGRTRRTSPPWLDCRVETHAASRRLISPRQGIGRSHC